MSGRRKFGNGFARADVTDVTDVTDVRKKEEAVIIARFQRLRMS